MSRNGWTCSTRNTDEDEDADEDENADEDEDADEDAECYADAGVHPFPGPFARSGGLRAMLFVGLPGLLERRRCSHDSHNTRFWHLGRLVPGSRVLGVL